MKAKIVFKWIYEQVSDYNLFMLDENDYADDDDITDPIIVLKQQKYKTWLYITLRTGNQHRIAFLEIEITDFLSYSMFLCFILYNSDQNRTEDDCCFQYNI